MDREHTEEWNDGGEGAGGRRRCGGKLKFQSKLGRWMDIKLRCTLVGEMVLFTVDAREMEVGGAGCVGVTGGWGDGDVIVG